MLSKEEHVIKMLKISPLQWMIFALVLLVNLLRYEAQGRRIQELGELCETDEDEERGVSSLIF